MKSKKPLLEESGKKTKLLNTLSKGDQMFRSLKKLVPVLVILSFPLMLSAQTCSENCTVKVKHFKEVLTFKQYDFKDDVFCANSCEAQTLTHVNGNLVINLEGGRPFCVKGTLEDATLTHANYEGPPAACARYGRSKGPSTVKLHGKKLRIYSMILIQEETGNLEFSYLHGNLNIKLKSGQDIVCYKLGLQRAGYIDGRGCDHKEWIKLSEISSMEQEPLFNDESASH
jgi:hypothetical protein